MEASMPRDLAQAIDLIRRFEGIADGDPTTVRLDPYLCPADYWTVGWGHVVRGPDGKPVRGRENRAQARAVYPDGISIDEAAVLLADDVRRFAAGIDDMVEVKINDNQFCALVSFAYNCGLGALKTSTLLRLLNSGEHDAVPAQLMRWTRVKGRESNGLKRRRAAEAALWQAT
jgi:lysozyme